MKKLVLLILCMILSFNVFACGGGNNDTTNPNTPDTDNEQTQDDLTPKGDILLSLGVISDPQIRAKDEQEGNMENGTLHMKAALNYYKNLEHPIDAYIMAGDMVDYARASAYDELNNCIDDVYGKERTDLPTMVFSPGNHEMYDIDSQGGAEFCNNLFRDKMNLELNQYYEINGYPIISITSTAYWTQNITKPTLDFLKVNLEKAYELTKNDGRPIIVTHHYPITNTVYGSKTEGASSSNQLNFLMKKYPNVIYLSGHSHYPIFDERSIYQKDFTAINTGTLSYACVGVPHEDKKQGSRIPYGNEHYPFDNTQQDAPWVPSLNEVSHAQGNKASQGSILNVYENVIDVIRLDFNKEEVVGGHWYIKTNPTKDDFIYTDDRKEEDEQPNFDADVLASATLKNGQVTINFKDANHSYAVESYNIELKKTNSTKILKSKCIISDYYCNNYCDEGLQTGYKVLFTVNDFMANYEVVITPISQFGIKGIPMVIPVEK